jgi:hypothetical protein
MSQPTLINPPAQPPQVGISSASSPGTSTGAVVLERPGQGVRRAVDTEYLRKTLLVCGVLSSVLYIGAEVYAWIQYPGYSPIAQGFSELLAEGAPTRPFMVAVAGAPYNLLVAAFGVAVWISAGAKRVPRIAAAMLVLYAVLSYLGGTVFKWTRGRLKPRRGPRRTNGQPRSWS